MSVPVVEAVALTRRYRAGDTWVRALDGVDLRIDSGEFVAIMGPSGSGKSTLLGLIGCLDRPTSGTYRLGGQDTGTLSDVELAKLRGSAIGFVFQGLNLLTRVSALTNVELPLVYAGVGRGVRRARALAALATVGLAGRAHHRPVQLSGGEQQRVAIARALVVEPRLLLADEPTGSLDSVTARDVLDLLTRLHREQRLTIVLVTHDPDVALRAERVVRFRDGRIVSDERQVPVGVGGGADAG